jgi:hypothetical protein
MPELTLPGVTVDSYCRSAPDREACIRGMAHVAVEVAFGRAVEVAFGRAVEVACGRAR